MIITKEDLENIKKIKSDYNVLNDKIADRVFEIVKLIVGRSSTLKMDLYFYFSSSNNEGEIGDFLDSCAWDHINYCTFTGKEGNKYWGSVIKHIIDSYDTDFSSCMPISFLTMTDEEIIQILEKRKDMLIKEKYSKIEKEMSLKESALSKLTQDEIKALGIKK